MTKMRIETLGFALSVVVTSAALAMSGSPVFAKTTTPKPAQASGNSISSGVDGGLSKRHGSYGGSCGHHCPVHSRPGTTLPPCRGAHKGPNGVMIQCQ
jgi:hypothetical protein